VWLASCEPAPVDVREWNAADHRQPAGAGQGKRQVAATDDKAAAEQTLADVTWTKRCASCHGPIGRGDGPQGPMLKAPDLTRDDWQAKVSDAQIAEVIRTGRGKMPAFELSEPQMKAVVQRIRRTRNQP